MARNNKSVNRRELAERLQTRLPLLTERERLLLVEGMLEAIAAALAEGRRVEIRGFGVFETRRRDARTAHNPRTGKTMHVPAKAIPFFRAGRLLLDRVNRATTLGD
jgi:integration host factor subunit beta